MREYLSVQNYIDKWTVDYNSPDVGMTLKSFDAERYSASCRGKDIRIPFSSAKCGANLEIKQMFELDEAICTCKHCLRIEWALIDQQLLAVLY